MSAPKSHLFAVMVVIVAVAVGAATVAPTLLGPPDDADGSVGVENQQFQPDAVLPEDAPERGDIGMTNNETGETVLVDLGHGNDVSETGLEPLLSTLSANGHEVRFYTEESGSFNESLRSADALLVVNPRRSYTADQLAGVTAFTDTGGRMLVLADPPSVRGFGGFFFGGFETTAARTASLGSTYGIAYGSGYLYNMERNDDHFQSVYARSASSDPLADGIDRVVMREAVPIRTDGAERVLVGVKGTHLSSTRDAGAYAVAVRQGNVTAVGDTDFLTRENAFDADNEVLIGNLADFLVGGERTARAPARPDEGGAGEGEGEGEGRGERRPRPPDGAEPSEPTPTPTPAPTSTATSG